jgi:Ion channel
MPNVLAALAIGLIMLMCSMLSYGIATTLIVQLGVRLIDTGYAGVSFWKNTSIMTFALLITAAAHLAQIALWAILFLLVGEISTFDRALYLSAQNYTALGYGDIVLSAHWRLLGPLEAINGLLLFGLSTAVMFAVLSRLVANRLQGNAP